MLRMLKDGSWLTRERRRLVALISGAMSLALLLFLSLTSHGTLDRWGRPLGTDFSDVYAAGRMALAGNAPDAWNWDRHYAVQQAVHHDAGVPFYGWHYPPPFLLLAALLAFLPYLPALLVWQGATLSAAAMVVRRIVPGRDTLLLAVAAPITFVCLGHGQNGFLTAALLGGGLLLIERRPLVAGLLLGCLVYKPQFALVVGPLLLVIGNKRAIAGAAGSSLLLVAATMALWGWPVWAAFLESLPLTRQVVIEGGATGWGKIDSPFAMIRMWGGGIGLAYAIQGAATLLAIAAALWLARSAARPLRNAAVAAAALLSTPYVLDYDFVLLGLGSAFLVRDAVGRGFLSWEKSLLALVWIAPLFARQAATIALLPLGQATALIVLGLAVRRALLLDDAAAGFRRTWPFRRSHAASAR
jgi:hypothetical protein